MSAGVAAARAAAGAAAAAAAAAAAVDGGVSTAKTSREESHLVLFYKYTPLSEGDLSQLEALHEQLARDLGLHGRVLLASEGINGTLDGTEKGVSDYILALSKWKRKGESDATCVFADVDWKRSTSPREVGRNFPDFCVKRVSEIVSLGIRDLDVSGVSVCVRFGIVPSTHTVVLRPATSSLPPSLPPSLRRRRSKKSAAPRDISHSPRFPLFRNTTIDQGGVHLKPESWRKVALETPSDELVIVDCRNRYEYDIGRFRGAVDPGMKTTQQWKRFVDDAAENGRFKGKTVLMYCTGGIRCEKSSAYLLKRCGDGNGGGEDDEGVGASASASTGIKQVYQLSGGIHRFLERFPDGGGIWKGKNFVFDRRVAMAGEEEGEGEGEGEGEEGKGEGEKRQQPRQREDEPKRGGGREEDRLGRCCRCGDAWDRYRGANLCCVCRTLVLICRRCEAGWSPEARAELEQGGDDGSRNGMATFGTGGGCEAFSFFCREHERLARRGCTSRFCSSRSGATPCSLYTHAHQNESNHQS